MSRARMLLGLVVMTGVLVLPATRGFALDVDEIVINQSTVRLDGAISGYAFDAYVKGAGITGGKIVNTNTAEEFPLSLRGDGSWGTLWMYATFLDFDNHHSNPGAYHFYLNPTGGGAYEDQVLLGFAQPAPTDYAHITNPTHGASGVSLSPLYQWDNIEGLGWAFGKKVRDGALVTQSAESPDFDLTQTSWQPVPPDPALSPGTYYEFMMSIHTITGGEPLIKETLSPGKAEGEEDSFTYYGLHTEQNQVGFTTQAVPEPATLMLLGTATLTLAALRKRRRMK